MVPLVPVFRLRSEVLSVRRRRIVGGVVAVVAVLAGLFWLRSDGSQGSEFSDEAGVYPEGTVSVPNVVGMTFEEVEEQMFLVGLVQVSQGDTDKRASWQTPVAGAPVDYGSHVTVGYGNEPKPDGVEFTDVAVEDMEPVEAAPVDPEDSPFPGGGGVTPEEIADAAEHVFPVPEVDTTPGVDRLFGWVRYDSEDLVNVQPGWEFRLVVDGDTVGTFPYDPSLECQPLGYEMAEPLDPDAVVAVHLQGPFGPEGEVVRPAYEFADGIQVLVVNSGIDGAVVPRLAWEGIGEGCGSG